MDSDKIFKKAEFQEWLNTLNINTQYAPPGQHAVNGRIESLIKTIKGNAKSMLRASGLPIRYWFYAFMHSVFLHNLARRKRTESNMYYKRLRPHEIFYSSKWTGHLPVLGQLVLSRDPKANDKPTLSDRGRECAFLGIDVKSHWSFILLHLTTKQIIRSRDVIVVKNVYAWTKKLIVPSIGMTTSGNMEPQDVEKSASEYDLSSFDDGST